MRIAMLGPYPHDENSIQGGVEAVVICLLKHLAALPDLELHMITCRPETAKGYQQVRLVDSASPRGAQWVIHYLPRKRWGRLMFHLRERRRIVALLRELRPDIVHAHAAGPYAAAALDSGWPTVITVHGIIRREAQIKGGRRDRLRGLLNSAFERSCLRRAGHLIAISPYVRQEFAEITRARIYDVENPIEDLYFQVDADPQPGRILFVGRLTRRKAVHHLLAAFDLVVKEYPQTELRLAGEGESEPAYAASLHRYVGQRGLGAKVSFLGPLRSIGETVAEYGRCAFTVLPSKQETASVVIAEAMAVGCPVIATKVGGAPYMIAHERTGLLVEYGDVQALAASMKRLLVDDALRIQMGRAAKAEDGRRFRGDSVAQQTYQVYRRVLDLT